MVMKPKQRIQLEQLRDEILTSKRGAIARYIEKINNETWSHSIAGLIARVNKLEKWINKHEKEDLRVEGLMRDELKKIWKAINES